MQRIHNPSHSRPNGTAIAAGLVLVVLLAIGCSSHRAFISYEEYTEVPLQASSFQGERIGPIFIKEGGAIWKECTDVARGSLWRLIDEAKRRGGNAVGDIRWMPKTSAPFADRPICKRRWGYFLVWPILATPAFMAANVEGVVYRIDTPEADAAEVAGLYLLPGSESETAQLVETILADTLPASNQDFLKSPESRGAK